MLNRKGYVEWILDSSREVEVLRKLYERGHLMADFIVEQIFGPEMSCEGREEVIRMAFGRLAGRVEMLETLTPDKRMRYLCTAVRDAALEEGRRRLQRELAYGGNRRIPGKKVTGGRMLPGVSDMVERHIVEDEWYLYVALRRLDTREFTLLIEKYQNRLSDKEIGRKMGIKARNVPIYMARARRKVTMYYEEELANGQRRDD